ncbi:MAG TPA: methyltransferase domain-containing protein [Candidatus Goldiibacteriota bacterium]|nr:methyltransferase domain-containing protein [Candidatus Goldiibacteriota bacterium]
MEYLNYGDFLKKLDNLIRFLQNKTNNKFNGEFINMLLSKVYTHGIYEDLKKASAYLSPGAKVLDLGTGIGFIPVLLDNRLYFDAFEIKLSSKNDTYSFGVTKVNANQKNIIQREKYLQDTWKQIKTSKTKYAFYNGVKIPSKSNKYDMVILHAVWEHIPRDIQPVIMKEIRRVLKKGGILYITRLPRKLAYQEYIARMLNLGGHEWLYSESATKKEMQEYGFQILNTSRMDVLFSFPHNIWNPVHKFIITLDKLLLKTPLSIFAHEFRIILKK